MPNAKNKKKTDDVESIIQNIANSSMKDTLSRDEYDSVVQAIRDGNDVVRILIEQALIIENSPVEVDEEFVKNLIHGQIRKNRIRSIAEQEKSEKADELKKFNI